MSYRRSLVLQAGNGSTAEDRRDLPLPDPDIAAVCVLAGGFTGTVFVRSKRLFFPAALAISTHFPRQIPLYPKTLFHNLQLLEE